MSGEKGGNKLLGDTVRCSTRTATQSHRSSRAPHEGGRLLPPCNLTNRDVTSYQMFLGTTSKAKWPKPSKWNELWGWLASLTMCVDRKYDMQRYRILVGRYFRAVFTKARQ